MKKIKFAIVGCGSIGARHLAVINEEEQAEIVAVCDIKEDLAKKYSDLYDVNSFTDYKEMLKSTKADVVCICTPHHLHAAMAIEAAKAKINILVEKPMALTIKDAESMMEAAKKSQVKLMIVKQNRYNMPVLLAKEALESKKLGNVFMVECNVLWNRYQEYYLNSNWRGKREFEGGALYTQVSHFIDLLTWWFGDIETATTQIDTKNHDIEIDDCGSSIVKFTSGVMGTLNWTTCVYNKNYEGSITIIGEYGTIKIGGQYLNKIEYWDVRAYPLPDNVDFSDKPNSYGKYQGSSSNHDKVIKDAISLLTNQKQNMVEGEEGLRSVKAIEKIYEGVRKQ
jgi:UDP-N-acetyl-2-amino-2-deoxyglucuronate dehydrogenase